MNANENQVFIFSDFPLNFSYAYYLDSKEHLKKTYTITNIFKDRLTDFLNKYNENETLFNFFNDNNLFNNHGEKTDEQRKTNFNKYVNKRALLYLLKENILIFDGLIFGDLIDYFEKYGDIPKNKPEKVETVEEVEEEEETRGQKINKIKEIFSNYYFKMSYDKLTESEETEDKENFIKKISYISYILINELEMNIYNNKNFFINIINPYNNIIDLSAENPFIKIVQLLGYEKYKYIGDLVNIEYNLKNYNCFICQSDNITTTNDYKKNCICDCVAPVCVECYNDNDFIKYFSNGCPLCKEDLKPYKPNNKFNFEDFEHYNIYITTMNKKGETRTDKMKFNLLSDYIDDYKEYLFNNMIDGGFNYEFILENGYYNDNLNIFDYNTKAHILKSLSTGEDTKETKEQYFFRINATKDIININSYCDYMINNEITHFTEYYKYSINEDDADEIGLYENDIIFISSIDSQYIPHMFNNLDKKQLYLLIKIIDKY